ncbi:MULTISPECIES: helix-turn-helix domain-containing protein [Sphingobium]|uniref:helix-turn-helix domain-containing protein n=1 Tax=Sphingobium TaxID=165695 RepID=UPI001375E7E0|nr:AraC family transcriptional regulator [Sphingobium indicum]
MATGIVLHLFRRIERQGNNDAPAGLDHQTMLRITEHIEANLGEAIHFDELALDAEMSRCRFFSAFRQSMGVTPHRYVTQRRVQLAACLIRSTDQELSQIALESGFSSQSHLTSTFRRMLGMTPYQYRMRRH